MAARGTKHPRLFKTPAGCSLQWHEWDNVYIAYQPSSAETHVPLRVWSAGCATGEEVATLLILLSETGAHPDSTVLGTDISGAALKIAERLHADGKGGCVVTIACDRGDRYFAPMKWEKRYVW